jgi:predicted chitinase
VPEKVLKVPQPEHLPQLTGFWCGPASCQTALQVVLNEVIEEQELANMMGTTENGTNHIGLLADALNAKAHHCKWEPVWLEQDPPTAQQKEQFWTDLRANCDAGFPMPANWVAPPGNHPVAVRGSGPNPAYSGTIFHYVCYTGYAEDATGRYVHVSDSGFRTDAHPEAQCAAFQYWVKFEQCVSLMPPKGYVKAAAAPAGVPALPGPAPAPAPHTQAELLSYAMDESLPLDRYEALLPGVLSCLEASQCTNVERIAQWMAQTGHESLGLSAMEEFASGEAYEGREDLHGPGMQQGDGVRYKGRSAIMITGRVNYGAVSAWAYGEGYVDSPTYFVDYPEQMASDDYGFMGTAWYWTVARGTQINDAADRQDHETVCRLINGGLNGYDDRVARYARAKEVAPQFLAILNESGPPETGDDFLSALTAEEQKEMLFLLRVVADERFPSRSPFRHINEGPVDTVAGMTLNTDASSHIMLVIRLAELGDTGALDLLNEIATCTDPERAGDAKLAQRVLTALRASQTVDQTPYDSRPAAAPPPAPAAPPPAPQPVRPAGGRWRL